MRYFFKIFRPRCVALSISALASVFTGCVKERFETEAADIGREVTIVVNIPGTQTPATRSMDGDPENEVTSIDILVFDASGAQQTYKERVQGSGIANSVNGTKRYAEFRAKLNSAADCNLVIVANAAAEVAALTLTAGEPKQSVLSKLQFTKTAAWRIGSGTGNYDPIPMYGETGKTNITPGGRFDDVPLRRMLARIDVSSEAPEFTLRKIHLVNYNTTGRIAPAWNATGGIVTPAGTDPNLPAAPGTQTGWNSAHSYELTGGNFTAQSFEGEIYAFEAAAATDASESARVNSACLVAEGTYAGQTYFYRIDFTSDGENGTTGSYMPLLRNYKYVVTIEKAAGIGYTTLGDAVNSYTVLSNLRTRIISYALSDLSEIAYNGQYMLGVGESTRTLYRESQQFEIKAFTDNPNGWRATIPAHAGSWLTFTSGNTAATGAMGDNNAKIALSAAVNNTGSPRTATVTVTADRLTQTVTVTQTVQSQYYIRITNEQGDEIDELAFGYYGATESDDPDAQRFYVSYNLPGNVTIAEQGGGTFTYTTSSDKPATVGTITGGAAMFNIQSQKASVADLQDPFFTKSTTLKFTGSDGMNAITKNLTLRQGDYNLTYSTEDYYTMDNGTYTFNVRANFEWTAEVIDNPNGVIAQLITTTGGNVTSAPGESVTFRTVEDLTDPSIFVGTAIVRIKSKHNEFPDTDIPLFCLSAFIQPESNCYMLKPSSNIGILIPVSRANTAIAGSIGENDPLAVELIWTDQMGGVKSITKNEAAINHIAVTGTGSTGYIYVLPGSMNGNAVVAVKVGGVIKWSWHIWVSGYEPGDGSVAGGGTTNQIFSVPGGSIYRYNNDGYAYLNSFMDRHLGATSVTPGQLSSTGLLYQWGRKDPFVGGAALSGASVTDLMTYKADGSQITAIPKTNGAVSLQTAVNNPATIYYQSNNNGNEVWLNTHIPTLWDNTDGSKTVYDPCPVGWRVPKMSATNVSPWHNLTNPANYTIGTGATWPSVGYYPASGYRYANSGLIAEVGVRGYTWIATQYTTTGWGYNFNFERGKALMIWGAGNTKANCFPVRCVKQ